MQKVDLNKVLEMLINEEQDEATGLVHEWFVQMSKAVHESLMQEDDAAQGIQDDRAEIKSEEHFGEAEDEEGTEEVGAVDDLEADLDAPADPAMDMDAGAEGGETVEVKKEDLQAMMANLQAEFMAIMNGESLEAPADDMADLDAVEPMDADPAMDMDMDAEPVDADVEESVFESEDEEVNEEADEFADLEESFTLEKVADPAMTDGKEVGKGGSITQNKKSPLPSHKGDQRAFKGEPVEIKAKEHKGHEREAAPEVKQKPLLKNQVKKAQDGRTPVSKEGDKSAMLNKKDGFGSDSPKSPLNGVSSRSK